MKNNKKPKHIITYLCAKCGFDFATTELHKPKCYYCDCEDDAYFKVLTKEKISPQVMAERLKLCADRMMENLKKAGADISEDGGEDEMLELLDKAKELKNDIDNLDLKN